MRAVVQRVTEASVAVAGEVRLISPVSSETTGRVIVHVALFPPEDAPMPKTGMMVSGRFELGETEALTVPATALGARGKDGRYTVKVLEGESGQAQKVSQRQVRVGLNNRVQAQVLEGLKEGERVVIGDASANGASRSRGGPPMF